MEHRNRQKSGYRTPSGASNAARERARLTQGGERGKGKGRKGEVGKAEGAEGRGRLAN